MLLHSFPSFALFLIFRIFHLVCLYLTISVVSKYEWHVNDLEPGTAYMVRFVSKDTSNGGTIINIGKETVYDTKPIGCAGDADKKGG